MRDARESRALSFAALGGFIALCFAVAAVGGAVTATSVGTWYAGLAKPPFNPPDWVFGPVWTVLYLMIAVAGWRLWRRRGEAGAGLALGAWGLQLALNLGWSLVFFGARMIGLALAEILVLLAAILATTLLSWRVDPLAGALFVPYALWVGFATVLNGALWWLN
jgi:tryptophan-rich sensory protein